MQQDAKRLEAEAVDGALMGFTGKQIIHPDQVPQKPFSFFFLYSTANVLNLQALLVGLSLYGGSRFPLHACPAS
jgi:hypothetical protein